jgi:hypothetical protein
MYYIGLDFFIEQMAAEVDYQVAAPAETSTPN